MKLTIVFKHEFEVHSEHDALPRLRGENGLGGGVICGTTANTAASALRTA